VSLIDEDADVATNRDVMFRHRLGDARSLTRAATLLNSYDTVSVQHEFGIFGGADGAEAIDFMSEITVPTAVTFHTVLDRPSRRQHEIIRRLAASAELVVVMSEAASRRLTQRYDIDPAQIASIPHGADLLLGGPSLATGPRPLVLTWGLIGPGKGLEAAIEAFGSLRDLDPLPRYVIAGATHPHVLHESGERYRDGLSDLVTSLRLQDIVEFDNRYRSRPSLARLVRTADIVLLPYESAEQVTSGVLVEAIAAGKPVVATEFPHAAELLGSGAGIAVPHGEVPALAEGMRRLLTDQDLHRQMATRARRISDGWYWPTIGARFSTVMGSIAARRRDDRLSTEVDRVAG
jgi:glycosyltransferase involved in cell wall biosynthesis